MIYHVYWCLQNVAKVVVYASSSSGRSGGNISIRCGFTISSCLRRTYDNSSWDLQMHKHIKVFVLVILNTTIF